jgi:hypothetical protein
MTLRDCAAQQGLAPDCLQPTLVPRCGFRQQLRPSVDMTSDVKRCLAFFLSSLVRIPRSLEEAEPVNTTVAPADIRGLGTTLLASVGRLPRSRHAGLSQPLNAGEDCAKPGLLLVRGSERPSWRIRVCRPRIRNLACAWHLTGDSPDEGGHFPGDGHHHLVGMFPPCCEVSEALA